MLERMLNEVGQQAANILAGTSTEITQPPEQPHRFYAYLRALDDHMEKKTTSELDRYVLFSAMLSELSLAKLPCFGQGIGRIRDAYNEDFNRYLQRYTPTSAPTNADAKITKGV